MLNNNIQKNAISKDKSQLPVKKRKLTRQEQINLTSEDRKRIWGSRRSINHKIQKQRNQTASPYLSDRKLIKFIVRFSVSLEKKRSASNELYIYKYNNTTKRVTTDFKYMDLQKKGVYGMSNFATMNVNKMLNNNNVEPDFSERKVSDNEHYATSHRVKNTNSTAKSQYSIQTETKKHQTESRSNGPSHKPWVPEISPAENRQKAFQTMSSGLNTPEFEKFVALVGPEIATAHFKSTLENTTREQ